jgi:hypothetical protein
VTDTDFVLLVDRLREASAEEVSVMISSAIGDPLRQSLLEEAIEFYGLLSTRHVVWSEAIDDPKERHQIARELIALRALTPMGRETPGWLRQCLGRTDRGFGALDETANKGSDHARRLAEVERQLLRLESESPTLSGLERYSGFSMDEIDAALPDIRQAHDERGKRGAAREGGVREARVDRIGTASRPAPARRALLAGGLVAIVLLATLPVLSAVTTPPAVSWATADSRRAANGAAPAARGLNDAEAWSSVDVRNGWAALLGSRRTFLGLFPRFDESGIERAMAHFERAGRYAEAPAATRGEALYGIAVAAWLAGDSAYARVTVSDPAVSFSAAAARAEALRKKLGSNR